MNKSTVLRLNANLMRIGWASPAQAFTAMMGESEDGSPPALGLDVHYKLDENGNFILDNMHYFDKLEWEYWMMLEPRMDLNGNKLDETIGTSHNIIRVPTIIVCPRYWSMPKKEMRATKSGIRERDGNKCAYTGVPLTNSTASVDHIHPKSKGGKDTWENLVACHKEVNTKKGNKTNDEAGLKLLVRPYAPKPMPLCALVKGNKHVDHNAFP